MLIWVVEDLEDLEGTVLRALYFFIYASAYLGE